LFAEFHAEDWRGTAAPTAWREADDIGEFDAENDDVSQWLFRSSLELWVALGCSLARHGTIS